MAGVKRKVVEDMQNRLARLEVLVASAKPVDWMRNDDIVSAFQFEKEAKLILSEGENNGG